MQRNLGVRVRVNPLCAQVGYSLEAMLFDEALACGLLGLWRPASPFLWAAGWTSGRLAGAAPSEEPPVEEPEGALLLDRCEAEPLDAVKEEAASALAAEASTALRAKRGFSRVVAIVVVGGCRNRIV